MSYVFLSQIEIKLITIIMIIIITITNKVCLVAIISN